MKTELEKFRTRWLRWLGQKTRYDKSCWVTLLDCNWLGWADKTLVKHGFITQVPQWNQSTISELKHFYRQAIGCADMSDLGQLDELYCIDLVEKRR